MDMIPVDSEAVAAIGHEGANLYVQYRSGSKTYVHAGVSPELHQQLMAAPSKGQFIAKHIRQQHPGKAIQ